MSTQLPLHPDQLAEALRRLAPRGWPATVEAVLACPLRARILEGYARTLARRKARHAQRQMLRPPQAAGALRLPRLTFDARRAAANDHDD